MLMHEHIPILEQKIRELEARVAFLEKQFAEVSLIARTVAVEHSAQAPRVIEDLIVPEQSAVKTGRKR